MRSEIFQQRIASVQASRNNCAAEQDKRDLRAKLESEVETFLAQGGEIETLPRGFSSEARNWNGSKLSAQGTMRSVMSVAIAEAHERRNNPNVLARKKAREEGLKAYDGAACKRCGRTLRYVSTSVCIACNNSYPKRRRDELRKGCQ